MKCRACKRDHSPLVRCEVFAATNVVVNAPQPVVNHVVNVPPVVVNKDRHKTTRKDYFREYMKVWRAVKSGRAELIGGRNG